MAYEDFKTTIEHVLTEAGKHLTWSEIKQRAGLLQKLPNNKWVRQVETDIGLIREKGKGGKMLWRVR